MTEKSLKSVRRKVESNLLWRQKVRVLHKIITFIEVIVVAIPDSFLQTRIAVHLKRANEFPMSCRSCLVRGSHARPGQRQRTETSCGRVLHQSESHLNVRPFMVPQCAGGGNNLFSLEFRHSPFDTVVFFIVARVRIKIEYKLTAFMGRLSFNMHVNIHMLLFDRMCL